MYITVKQVILDTQRKAVQAYEAEPLNLWIGKYLLPPVQPLPILGYHTAPIINHCTCSRVLCWKRSVPEEDQLPWQGDAWD